MPVSIFDNEELSCFETIVKYLKEEVGLKNREIAVLLNRDNRTTWATYNKALRKRKQALIVKDSAYQVPIFVFTERKLSVLETLVSYLKESFNLRYSRISIMLNRDERNIWTVYSRALKKRGKYAVK